MISKQTILQIISKHQKLDEIAEILREECIQFEDVDLPNGRKLMI